MSLEQEIYDDYVSSLQGDEAAARRIAQRLAAAGTTQPEGAGIDEFQDAAKEYIGKNPDVWSNPEKKAIAVETDKWLVANRPELKPRTRVQMAFNAARSGSYEDIAIEADRSITIQQMKAGRGPHRVGSGPPLTDGGEEEVDEATEQSRVIEQMGRDRGQGRR